MLICITIIISLAACEKNNNESVDDTQNSAETETNEETISDSGKEDVYMEFENDYFQKFETPTKIFAVESGNINAGEKVMLETLQGILAKKGSPERIYIIDNDAYLKWLTLMKQKYDGVTITYKTNAWELAEYFKQYVSEAGFVSYKLSTTSENAACTLAGQLGYIAVDKQNANKAVNAGFTEKFDAEQDYPDDESVFETFKDGLSKKFLFQQNFSNHALRDLGVAYGAYYFSSSSVAKLIMEHVEPNSPLFGWHTDEVTGVNEVSKYGIVTLASDHAYNLSVLSSLPRKNHIQPATKKNAVADDDVHYVTFMMSDGDNVQWNLNGALLDKENFGNVMRGTTPMGWTVPPSLSDLAPVILDYGYENMSENDCFIAAVSGFGYVYPSRYKLENLAGFAELTAYYMDKSGLSYMQLLDDGQANPSDESMSLFTQHYTIKGIFYMTGDKYRMGKGKIMWSNDKPVVFARESLWTTGDITRASRDKTLYEMAVRINTYDKDIYSIEGYTAVNVHAWSHSYEDVVEIQRFIKTLPGGDKVIFVTPDEFMELISKNLAHENKSPVLNGTSPNRHFDYSVIK